MAKVEQGQKTDSLMSPRANLIAELNSIEKENTVPSFSINNFRNVQNPTILSYKVNTVRLDEHQTKLRKSNFISHPGMLPPSGATNTNRMDDAIRGMRPRGFAGRGLPITQSGTTLHGVMSVSGETGVGPFTAIGIDKAEDKEMFKQDVDIDELNALLGLHDAEAFDQKLNRSHF